MFERFFDRNHTPVVDRPFPAAQLAVLEHNVKHYARLDDASRKRLCSLVQAFIANKHWEGCGGLELTEEMQVTIAAQACLLVLELPHRLYRNVQSILVYASTVVRPVRRLGVFERPTELVEAPPVELLGEAHLGGPVILAWDRVLRDGRRPQDGHNLVYHEFAHKLDMLDGEPDGTPPLATRDERRRWHRVCERVFLELREHAQRGERTSIDAYGATNEAEFFAVATEHFFDRPRALQASEPELYAVLAAFYRQDPATLSDV
jgi:Mlc titration factor MtfA (ptsG expression regulator)